MSNPTRSRVLAPVGAREAASLFFAVTPERPYARPLPEIYGGADDIHADLTEQFEAGPVSPPAGGIALLAKASVLAGGVVLTSSGQVVVESLVNTHHWREFWPFAWKEAAEERRLRIKMLFGSLQKYCGPTPHILIKQTFDDNYGHWLVECLPRIVLVDRHFDLSACKIIVPDWSDGMRQIYRDSLAVFGVADHQLVEVAYAKAVHVDKLIYPLPVASHPWVKSPRAIAILEMIPALLAPGAAGPRRLYVSRNRYMKRRLINEPEILDVCREHGFTVIFPETMDFESQVRAFRDAEIVIGNCGANLTNFVFAPRGSTVLALTSEFMDDNFYWDLAAVKAIRYVSLHGHAEGRPPGPERDGDFDLDFTIDVERFRRLLDDLIVSVPCQQRSTASRDPFLAMPPTTRVIWHDPIKA